MTWMQTTAVTVSKQSLLVGQEEKPNDESTHEDSL